MKIGPTIGLVVVQSLVYTYRPVKVSVIIMYNIRYIPSEEPSQYFRGLNIEAKIETGILINPSRPGPGPRAFLRPGAGGAAPPTVLILPILRTMALRNFMRRHTPAITTIIIRALNPGHAISDKAGLTFSHIF